MPDDADLIIEPQEAARLVRDDDAILVDVVGTSSWPLLKEVPARSLRIPPQEFRERAPDLPFERTLITYCT